MTFVLTPRFTPAYQAPQCSPFGFCGPVSRPTYSYRVARPRPQRPQYSSFNHFFSQVDELLGEIDREAQRQALVEAQREAHRQRQQRKRALRAKFTVNQTEQGWQVDGDIRGFDNENISIEVTDEHTLKITGNTKLQAAKNDQQEDVATSDEAAPTIDQPAVEPTSNDNMDGVTLNEPEFDAITDADTATIGATTADSDTESQKSYQATVEDDFEDLGADSSSLVSSTSRPASPNEVKEPKGKEKAFEEPSATEVTVAPQPEAHIQEPAQEQQQEERVHGSFERSFRFPQRIDGANVSASFKDGALRIQVPKAQVEPIRKIAIL